MRSKQVRSDTVCYWVFIRAAFISIHRSQKKKKKIVWLANKVKCIEDFNSQALRWGNEQVNGLAISQLRRYLRDFIISRLMWMIIKHFTIVVRLNTHTQPAHSCRLLTPTVNCFSTKAFLFTTLILVSTLCFACVFCFCYNCTLVIFCSHQRIW